MRGIRFVLVVLTTFFMVTGAVTVDADSTRAEDLRFPIAPPTEDPASSNSIAADTADLEVDCIGPEDASSVLVLKGYEEIRHFVETNLMIWDGTSLMGSKDFVSEYVQSNGSTVTVLLNSSNQDLGAWQLGMRFDAMRAQFPDIAVRECEYDVQSIGGILYAMFNRSQIGSGMGVSFSQFTPMKEEIWFSFGSAASIQLSDHPMFISTPTLPGDIETSMDISDQQNGSAPVEVCTRSNELWVSFEGSDLSGQCVTFNRSWLEVHGISNPIFQSESGGRLLCQSDSQGYVITMPHFSAIVVRESFSSAQDGFVFTELGGSSFLSNCINDRDGAYAYSPTYSIHQGYTGGNADGTDWGVVSARKSYSYSKLESVSIWFYVSDYSHTGGAWDYLKAGIRINLMDSQGAIVAKFEYWLASWWQNQDYMDPSDPDHEKKIYGMPPLDTWVKFYTTPNQDWGGTHDGIPWESTSSIDVELFVHGSGTYNDHFEIHFDDLVLSVDTSCVTYLFNGAVEVNQDSQTFQFSVPASAVYVAASMSFAKFGTNPSEACNVDASYWDAMERRTGGYTFSSQMAREEIPNSAYSILVTNPEYMYVTGVAGDSAGIWKASTYCRATSDVGALFEIRIDVYLNEIVQSESESTRFYFSAPSNSYAIGVELDHSSRYVSGYVDHDLSVWDGIGRRTGGYTSSEQQTKCEIYHSDYSGWSSNPEWVTVEPARTAQELWSTGCYAFLQAGFYHISVKVEIDSDCDGVRDSEDLDPGHDLCVRLTVFRIEEQDRMEPTWPPGEKSDPFLRILAGDEDMTSWNGDSWESEVWSHSIIPLDENPPGGAYDPDYIMWKNVPDNRQTVNLMIQVWDDDGVASQGQEVPYPDGIHYDSIDDIADISKRPGGGSESNPEGSTLHITYDLLSELWYGDDSNAPGGGDSNPGRSSGEEDGYAGDEDDAEIQFTLETVHELSAWARIYLAEKFSPVMYFESDEEYYPIEVRAMLDQSNLRNKDNPSMIYDDMPMEEESLAAHRLDSYIDQELTSQSGYENLIYSNVFVTDEDRIIIQYWFFYLKDITAPSHEGDWEMIQIVFGWFSYYDYYLYGDSESLVPETAGYSQHYDGDKKPWSYVQKEDYTHPKVFVEKGGHASYIDPYGQSNDRRTYPIGLMCPNSWLNYGGKWGESDGSVRGPVYRYSKPLGGLGDPCAYIWHEPVYWLDHI